MSEDVTIRHKVVVEDHGSKEVEHIGGAFHGAAHAAEHLKEHVGHLRREMGLSLPTILGVGVGLGAWIEKTKEATAEFGILKRQLTGLFSTGLQWDKHLDFTERYNVATKLAAEQTEELEHVAMRFGGTLVQVGENYKQLTLGLGGMGLSRERLQELTTHVRATAKVMGIEAGALIEKITNAALFKQVARRGDAGKFLAMALGTGNVRGMSSGAILEKIDKAMNKLVPTADKVSQGMGDAINRIHLSVDALFRTLGTPLFKEIGKSLSGWAESISHASEGARPLVEQYAEKLVEAFHTAKDITSALLEHWKAIALIWAGFKLGGGGAIGSALGGIAGPFAGALGTSATALGTFAKQTAAAAGALAILYAGLSTFADWLDKKHSERMAAAAPTEGGGGTVLAAAQALASGQLRVARGNLGNGLMDEHGQLNAGALQAALQNAEENDLQQIGRALGVQPRQVMTDMGQIDTADAGEIAKAFADKLNQLQIQNGSVTSAPEDITISPKVPNKFSKQDINFNVAKLEVTQKFEDADPERVFLRFKEDLEDQVVRPAVSIHSEALGF